jgi:hypothetical protein
MPLTHTNASRQLPGERQDAINASAADADARNWTHQYAA